MRNWTFCIPTHRRQMFSGFVQEVANEYVNISVATNGAFLKKDHLPAPGRTKISRVHLGMRLHDLEGRFHFTRAFYEAVKNAKTEFVVLCDDDFRMHPGTETSGGSSIDRIDQAVKALRANPKLGAVQLVSFLGGATKGIGIYPITGRSLELARGHVTTRELFLKHARMHEGMWRAGAGGDSAFLISLYLAGYEISRSYNNPTTRAGNINKLGNGNPNYDEAYIMTAGPLAPLKGKYRYFQDLAKLKRDLA